MTFFFKPSPLSWSLCPISSSDLLSTPSFYTLVSSFENVPFPSAHSPAHDLALAVLCLPSVNPICIPSVRCLISLCDLLLFSINLSYVLPLCWFQSSLHSSPSRPDNISITIPYFSALLSTQKLREVSAKLSLVPILSFPSFCSTPLCLLCSEIAQHAFLYCVWFAESSWDIGTIFSMLLPQRIRSEPDVAGSTWEWQLWVKALWSLSWTLQRNIATSSRWGYVNLESFFLFPPPQYGQKYGNLH